MPNEHVGHPLCCVFDQPALSSPGQCDPFLPWGYDIRHPSIREDLHDVHDVL